MRHTLTTDALNFWTKTADRYQNEANRLAHEAAALEYESAILDPRLKESTLIMADCKRGMAALNELYARTMIAHSNIIAKIVEEKENEGGNSSGSVPGTTSTLGSSGTPEQG